MTVHEFYQAMIMGGVEAVTEFLPVSSTGHLIIAGKLINFQGPPGHVFEIAIQFGAVLAICVLYFQRLWRVVADAPRDPSARHFIKVSLIAFFPAIIAGALFHNIIKEVLFNPTVVCASLLLGGFAILLIEKKRPEPVIHEVEAMPYKTALMVGLAQCLALIPGVSRSGATIMGALMARVDRKCAAEFSFFQAIPLLGAATVFDLWSNRADLDFSAIEMIGVGFIVSFIGAMIVVKWMIGYVTRHGFGAFAWYRIIVGAAGLAAIAFIPGL